jgi:hypothetical protein
VKIYVAAVEAFRKKERQGETQETINFSGIRKVRKSQYEMLKLSAKC